MSPSERICSNCGWQNEPIARMCGGCGQPLGTLGANFHNVPPAPRRADGSPFTSTINSGNAPTEYLQSGVNATYLPNAGKSYSPLDPTHTFGHGIVNPPPVPGTKPARWPAATAQPQPAYTPPPQPTKRRGGSCLQCTLFTLLTLVVVTSCCGVGFWSFVVRPALHTATDSQIRAGLDSMFDDASTALEQALPLLPAGQILNAPPIKAADINAALPSAAAKKGVPASTKVYFIGIDGVQVTYLLSGKTHSVITHLYVDNGRIKARETTDDFPLNMWESNTELETTINEALMHLTPDVHVTELHMANDTLHFSFKK